MEVRKDLIYKLLEIINAKDDITWITVKGNHIPIKKGQSKSEAIGKFFDSKKQTQTIKPESKSYENILNKVKESNSKNITGNDILESLSKNKNFKYSIDKVREKIEFAEAYNRNVVQTITKFRNEQGCYTSKRNELHKKILTDIFANADKAKPKNGEKPTFIMLGGRGGSGKSKFNGLVYNKDNFIVLDADAIKERIPEYRGYNAFEVHEESSDILNRALAKARKKGLNVVLDATMKTEKSVKSKIDDFTNADYNIEMYYMHLPREKSTERAIGRFMGANGRYVPLDVLLSMKNNEFNFDKFKKYASKWAMYDNDVASKDIEPKLIAKS